MPFERSFEIEQRLETVLRLIRTGGYSTPMLAEEVGVSIPTISRCVTALRDRGHDIQAERHDGGWRYVLVSNESAKSPVSVKTSAREMAHATELRKGLERSNVPR